MELIKRVLKACLYRCPLLYEFVIIVLRRATTERRVLIRILRRGDTVIDVGANDGLIPVQFDDTNIPGTPDCLNFLCLIPDIHSRELASVVNLLQQ